MPSARTPVRPTRTAAAASRRTPWCARAAATLASLVLAACSSGPGDAGADARADGEPRAETGADTGADTALDAAMDAPGDGGADGAPDDAPSDPLAAQRQACAFTTGALVRDTLGVDDATRAAIPIRHIVVVMKENRSFDHLLGRLHDQGQPGTEAIPADFGNRDLMNVDVAPFHETTTCIGHDPDHQWAAMHAQVNNGAMSGFVRSAAVTTGTNGHFAIGYYDQTDLPFYYWLANTYALNDRHFASVRSGTFPNRNFLLLGTADGVMATGGGYPDPSTPTIFDALDRAGVTWGVYSDGSLLSGALDWNLRNRNTHTFTAFQQALADGTLPQVAFVDGVDNVEDEHPTANVQQGEAWTRDVYERAVASPLWPGMAMIWTYDEAGGFFDHVPPPNHACIARPVTQDQAFFELGTRVPLAVISPYARAHYVSHVVQEHTAITRFIETVFNLPALTARDANSDALLDLFDFASPPAFMTPPAAPASGTHGCFDSCVLTTDQPNYHPGDAIRVTFAGCPGDDPTNWIAVYPYTSSGPTAPHPGSIVWEYVGGTHAGTTMPTDGTITLDASSVSAGPWPLPAGGYIAYYLLNDQYTQIASIDFNVVP